MWYAEAAKIAFRRRLAYRSAAIAGSCTNFAFGLLRAYVFQAVATANGGLLAGYSVQQLNTFSMATQVLLSTVAVWSHVEMPAAIISGQIASDLCKPTDLYLFYQAREVGKAVHDLVMRGLPLIVGYALLLDLTWPSSAVQWSVVWLSLTLGWLVSYSWRFLVGAIAFWTMDVRGAGAILFTLAMLLMGFLFPLPIAPEWLQTLASWTPFPSILQAPLDVYMGRTPAGMYRDVLLTQAAWALVMMAFSKIVLHFGKRRMVVQGG